MNDCIFCKIVKGEIPSKKIYEDEKVLVIMDASPRVDGHSLILPKEHIEDFTSIDADTLNHVFGVAKVLGPKMMKQLGATGLTCGVNYGESQAVKHFHLHLLPDFLLKEKTDKTIEEVYAILKED